MEFNIPAENMETLEKKLKKIENKCAAYNIPFVFKKINENYVKEKDGVHKYITIEVSGTAIVNGWEFVATIEHKSTANVLRSYSDAVIPEKYYTCSAWCDHCHTDRDRKDTYLIRNTKTNEFKQVGRSCLKDFTNGLSAEQAAEVESYYKEAEQAQNEYEGCNYTRYFNVIEFLECANEMIRLFGFLGKAKTAELREQGNDVFSTFDRTVSCFNPVLEYEKDLFDKAKEKGFNPDTEENHKQVSAMIEWIKSKDTNGNEYLNNLKVLANEEFVERRDASLLASLPASYLKETKWESKHKKQQESEKNSKYLGNVGDKIDKHNVTVKCVYQCETDYGMLFIYNITDSEGNVMVWKTSKCLEECEKITEIKGTIKAIGEYKGIKQTELTRCKTF